MKLDKIARTLAAVGLATAAASAFAGRPLLVDDAGINKQGEGHVETWVARSEGVSAFTVSPAYAFWDNVELAAALSRANTAGLTTTSVQGKWMITPAKDDGCNVAAALGALRVKTDFGSANGSYLTGIFSCNGTALGNVHFNLGYSKPSGGSGETSYGVALEKSFGALTPHIEFVGSENTDTLVNLGLRGDIAKNLQLDGSVGRSDGVTVYTVGLKFRF